jgi:flagellin
MSRINTNVPSIVARRILSHNNKDLNLSLERLSTGFRINRGKDDPAGLIASERMRAELVALDAAQKNVTRTINMISVAESGLNEVTNLMNDLEELVDLTSNEAAITDEEVRANQLEIDNILESIDRIAGTTELQGKKLLNGELGFNTSGITISQFSEVHINAARIANGASRAVTVSVDAIASQAVIAYTGGAITSTPRTVEVQGNLGTERFTFSSGTSEVNIASAINQSVDLTGVRASVAAGNVYLISTDYGSDQFVRVRPLQGPFTTDKTYDEGADATVSVNGMTAVTRGLHASVRTNALSADFLLTTGFGTQTAVQGTFTVTGGGAKFNITPEYNLSNMAPIGIEPMTVTHLGSGDVGYLYDLRTGGQYALDSGNFREAQEIVRAAAMQVASTRGRLGAFEANTLDTTMNSLKIQYENVAAAESVIRDTDFAMETAEFTKSQILVQAATMVLGRANAAPQNVLALLQQ